MDFIRKPIKQYADQIGITGATLCLIHCILTSAVAIFSASLSHTHSHSYSWSMWTLFDIVLMFISVVAVIFAARMSSVKIIKLSLWFFLLTFVVATFGKSLVENHWLEYISYLASFGLIATHIVNLRFRACPTPVQKPVFVETS